MTRGRATPTVKPVYLVAHPGSDLYGSDRVMIETVGALVQTGGDVVVTLPADGPLVPYLRERGARVVFTPTLVVRRSLLTPRGFISLITHTIRGLIDGRNLIRDLQPSVVWTNTLTIPLWIFLARFARLRVVVHVHEAESSSPRLLLQALSFPLLFAHHLVANSNFTASVLSDLFPRLAARCTVIYNGVSGPAAYTAPRNAIDGPLRILYVGRLSPRKGPDVLVRAMAELVRRGVSSQLEVVGAVFPGYEWFEKDLRDSIEALKLEDAVTLKGFADSPWQSLADCDVLVVLSLLEESFGNTVVEGILAARPVIVSDSSGLREAAWGYQSAQQVKPGNVQGIADALQRAIDNWAELSAEAVEDERTARARHSIASYRQNIVRVVESVAVGAELNLSPTLALPAHRLQA